MAFDASRTDSSALDTAGRLRQIPGLGRRGSVIAALALGLGALVAVLVLSRTGGESKHTSATNVQTYTVVRRDLEANETASGTLAFDQKKTTIANRIAAGVVTWLPPEGSIVEIGAALYGVGGAPVVLMRGTRPASRTLAE